MPSRSNCCMVSSMEPVGWAKSPAAASDMRHCLARLCPRSQTGLVGQRGQRRRMLRANNPTLGDAPLPTLQRGGRECRAEGLAHMRTMQPGVVALLWAARRYLEIRKNRPRPRQQRADLLLEDAQVGEFMHCRIARRPREPAKVHPVATGDRMAPIPLLIPLPPHTLNAIGRPPP